MHTFSIRDLREYTGTLVHDAESGHLSLVTKRGKPIFLAVPFTAELVEAGLRPTLAVKLFRDGVLTLEKAAKVAHEPMEAFVERLSLLNIPLIDYSVDEIKAELKEFE